jgi:hypothetical protein
MEETPMPLRPLRLLTLATGALAACSMIPAVPGAATVLVTEAGKVTQCEFLGSTTVSVLHKIAGLERGVESVDEDLTKVAQNTAIESGGDTLVPLGPVSEGRRKFGIYKCRR